MTDTTSATVFPGQGTQTVGMGKDFYDGFVVSRKTYEQASDALGWDVAQMCFEENTQLELTEFAQPCILTTEIAIFRALQAAYDFQPDIFGGHSLGEYTALVAAGVMPFARAVKAVQERGRLMQAAVPPGIGGMAAVIATNLDVEALRESLKGLPLDVANINSPDQIVVSGQADSLVDAEDRIRQAIASDQPLQFIPLNVSAPFHSRFMVSIEKPFNNVLNDFSDEISPEYAGDVTSNSSGGFHQTDTGAIINNLVSQLSNPVQWCDNMRVISQQAQVICEIGPKRPLRSFFRKMEILCHSITSIATAKRVFSKYLRL
jgi:[acyl-carrier-protein] S-malonyltransferase